MTDGNDVVAVLKSAGYDVRIAAVGQKSVEFEDAAVFGFVEEYDSIRDLLDRWKLDHDRYLSTWVGRIRNAAEKRSNIYAIFISAEPAVPEHLRALGAIEENFVGSRKIVGVGVSSRDHVRALLLPLLPLQASSRIEEDDLLVRLEARLENRPHLFKQLTSVPDAEGLVKGVLGE